MTRYFMTIPEAVSLVVQAGSIGTAGDIFVLDMGEPVRILDLAENMIRLSGRNPNTDIAISFIGSRPGETLHEELWADDESVSPTGHTKILRLQRSSIDPVWLDSQLGELEQLTQAADTLEVVAKLSTMVREPQFAAARRESANLP
jgi:FlaA1/EpsC-like NDP-sugar epimerase